MHRHRHDRQQTIGVGVIEQPEQDLRDEGGGTPSSSIMAKNASSLGYGIPPSITRLARGAGGGGEVECASHLCPETAFQLRRLAAGQLAVELFRAVMAGSVSRSRLVSVVMRTGVFSAARASCAVTRSRWSGWIVQLPPRTRGLLDAVAMRRGVTMPSGVAAFSKRPSAS